MHAIRRVALYLRRSKDKQEASIQTQRTEALRYCEAKGWSVSEEHIYIDDAISRAEFKKRPRLMAMLRACACESKEFDAVVTRDETRLGGDMVRTTLLISDILDHGVSLFYYIDDQEVRLDGATDKFMIAAKNFASELEREKISSRTYERLAVKAREGYVVAGKCYGYRHVPIMVGDKKVRSEYAIEPKEAEVLVSIFEKFSRGIGIRLIAHELNAKGIPSPRAGKSGTGSWGTSSIHEMLKNERYLGKVIWNRENEAIYRGGTKLREFRPQEEWIVVDKPELRIISDDLWTAARARIRPGQRRPRCDGKYLLSGLARCSSCGGPINVRNTKWGKTTVKGYACKYNRDRGDTVCGCNLIRPIDKVDELVIQYVESRILREEVITEALTEVRRRLNERANQPSEIPDLEAREGQLNKDVQRLTAALLTTDEPLESVTKLMAEKEGQLRELRARISALRTAPSVIDLEARKLEQEARTRLADLRGMLRRNPADGRKALRMIFKEPLAFKMIKTPEGQRFEISGRCDTPISCVPNEIRTRVTALKGPCPGPG